MPRMYSTLPSPPMASASHSRAEAAVGDLVVAGDVGALGGDGLVDGDDDDALGDRLLDDRVELLAVGRVDDDRVDALRDEVLQVGDLIGRPAVLGDRDDLADLAAGERLGLHRADHLLPPAVAGERVADADDVVALAAAARAGRCLGARRAPRSRRAPRWRPVRRWRRCVGAGWRLGVGAAVVIVVVAARGGQRERGQGQRWRRRALLVLMLVWSPCSGRLGPAVLPLVGPGDPLGHPTLTPTSAGCQAKVSGRSRVFHWRRGRRRLPAAIPARRRPADPQRAGRRTGLGRSTVAQRVDALLASALVGSGRRGDVDGWPPADAVRLQPGGPRRARRRHRRHPRPPRRHRPGGDGARRRARRPRHRPRPRGRAAAGSSSTAARLVDRDGPRRRATSPASASGCPVRSSTPPGGRRTRRSCPAGTASTCPASCAPSSARSPSSSTTTSTSWPSASTPCGFRRRRPPDVRQGRHRHRQRHHQRRRAAPRGAGRRRRPRPHPGAPRRRRRLPLRQRRLPRGRRQRRRRSPAGCAPPGVDAASSHDVVALARGGSVLANRLLREAGRDDRRGAGERRQPAQPERHRHRRDRSPRPATRCSPGCARSSTAARCRWPRPSCASCQASAGDLSGVVGAAVMVIDEVLAPDAVDRYVG